MEKEIRPGANFILSLVINNTLTNYFSTDNVFFKLLKGREIFTFIH